MIPLAENGDCSIGNRRVRIPPNILEIEHSWLFSAENGEPQVVYCVTSMC